MPRANKQAAKVNTAELTLEQKINQAIENAFTLAKSASDISGKAKAARETLRSFYTNLETRELLVSIINAITDMKKRVWALKVARYEKSTKTASPVASISFDAIKALAPTFTPEQKRELLMLLV